MTPYRYIVIEGNIGAGKTSLATRLAHHWSSKLILESFAENPFLPKFYENRERYAFSLELSFLTERFSQLKQELQTQDLFSPMIIADYFIGKCQIFAKNNLQKDEYTLFLKMYEIVAANMAKPDLFVYLYLGIDQLQQNIRARGRSYEQHIQDDYLDNIQKQYLTFIRQHTDMRVLIINTEKLDFVNRPEDFHHIQSLIQQEYPIGITRIETTP